MINFIKIKKDYDTNCVLNRINLKKIKIDAFFENLFRNNILEFIDYKKKINQYVYLNYMEVEFLKSEYMENNLDDEKKLSYSKMYEDIKKKIEKITIADYSKAYEVLIINNNKNDDKINFLVIYVSNNKEIKPTRFNDMINMETQRKVLGLVFNILLKVEIIKEISESNYISASIFNQDLFMGVKREDKNDNDSDDEQKEYRVSVFKYFGFVDKDFNYIFSVKLELFAQLFGKEYENCSIFDKVDYKNKKDAREYDRNFISCSDFKNSKLGVMLFLYDKLKKVFEKYTIGVFFDTFNPRYIFNNLYYISEEDKNKNIKRNGLNIYMDQRHFENMVACQKNNKWDKEYFYKYIKGLFEKALNVKADFNTVTRIEEIDRNKPYIFMIFNEKNKGYITRYNEKTKEWVGSNKNFLSLIGDENIKNFDLYTRLKLENITNLINGGNKNTTQGFVVDKNFFMKDYEEVLTERIKTHEKKIRDNNEKGLDKKIKFKEPNKFIIGDKSFSMNDKLKNKLKKIKNEIYLKNIIFHERKIPFNLNNDCKYNKIEVYYRPQNRKGSDKIYSYFKLIKGVDGWEVFENKILCKSPDCIYIDENSEIDKKYDLYIAFDDKYVLKIQKKDSIIILGRSEKINKNLNENYFNVIVKRTLDNETNLLFPYSTPSIRKICDDKESSKKANKKSCVYVEKSKFEYKAFVKILEKSLEQNLSKTTLLSIFEICSADDMGEELSEEERESVLAAYLSFSTFDLISVELGSKTTILEKIAKIIIEN